jgi:hypothetical protein
LDPPYNPSHPASRHISLFETLISVIEFLNEVGVTLLQQSWKRPPASSCFFAWTFPTLPVPDPTTQK